MADRRGCFGSRRRFHRKTFLNVSRRFVASKQSNCQECFERVALKDNAPQSQGCRALASRLPGTDRKSRSKTKHRELIIFQIIISILLHVLKNCCTFNDRRTVENVLELLEGFRSYELNGFESAKERALKGSSVERRASHPSIFGGISRKYRREMLSWKKRFERLSRSSSSYTVRELTFGRGTQIENLNLKVFFSQTFQRFLPTMSSKRGVAYCSLNSVEQCLYSSQTFQIQLESPRRVCSKNQTRESVNSTARNPSQIHQSP